MNQLQSSHFTMIIIINITHFWEMVWAQINQLIYQLLLWIHIHRIREVCYLRIILDLIILHLTLA